MENVIYLEICKGQSDFAQILDRLGTKDYSSRTSENVRLFRILGANLNCSGNRKQGRFLKNYNK